MKWYTLLFWRSADETEKPIYIAVVNSGNATNALLDASRSLVMMTWDGPIDHVTITEGTQ